MNRDKLPSQSLDKPGKCVIVLIEVLPYPAIKLPVYSSIVGFSESEKNFSMASAMVSPMSGSTKFMVPIWMALEPVSRNSIASVKQEIPPMPTTGIFTAL